MQNQNTKTQAHGKGAAQTALADKADQPQQSQPATPGRADEPSPREDYTRLAAAISTMHELDSDRFRGRLDVAPWDANEDDHVLWRAMNAHRRTIFEQLDFQTPEGQHLYVEMRLLHDAQRQRHELEVQQSATEEGSEKKTAATMRDEMISALNARFPDLSPHTKRFADRLAEVLGKAYALGGYELMEKTMDRVQSALDAAAPEKQESEPTTVIASTTDEKDREFGEVLATLATVPNVEAEKREGETGRFHPIFEPVTPERAQEMVNRILRYDDDDDARALIALIGGIAYDANNFHRDEVALHAINRAYSLTIEFNKSCDEFAKQAISS